jgi:uncharacterized protein
MHRVFSLLIFFSLFAAPPPSVQALTVPPLQGRVNDHAGLLSARQAEELAAKLKTYEEKTTNQIVLLTLPSLQGEAPEEFSIRVAREWGLGQEKRNNGVLILIAKQERAVRIEVGYGLEGALTDAQSSAIIRNIIVPAFREGDYHRGIENGIDAIESAVAGEFQPEPALRGSKGPNGGFIEGMTIGLILLILLATFLSSLSVYLHALIGGIIGGAVGMLLKGGLTAFILVGALIEVVLALLSRSDGSAGGGWSRRSRGTFWSARRGAGEFGRGFGGGFGGGGFSGGGGSFGGGGASGRW